MNEKSSGSRSRKQILTAVGTRCADHVTPLYPQKLALTSPTGGGRSVGIVRVRTKATGLELVSVYQKGVLCFLIQKSYIRSIKSYCFVREYAAISVQLEIFIIQYTGWCVLIKWTFIIITIIIIITKNLSPYFFSPHCTEQSQHGTENMATFKHFGMTVTCK